MFAEPFFAERRKEMPNWRLERVTLRTGENLRRFPQWHPAYANEERTWSRVLSLYPVGKDGELRVEEGYVS
jgi:hypothetical protein